jgi:hypothetical protein
MLRSLGMKWRLVAVELPAQSLAFVLAKLLASDEHQLMAVVPAKKLRTQSTPLSAHS